MLGTYVAANVVIIMGYMMLSILVAPVTDFRKWYTKIGALVFFMTCALHHFHNVVHSVDSLAYRRVELNYEHIVIDILQAIAVWIFIIGLSQEVRYRRIPIKDVPVDAPEDY